jgi:hypothetical protein
MAEINVAVYTAGEYSSIAASGVGFGLEAFNAFDENDATLFSCNAATGWLEFELLGCRAITKIAITARTGVPAQSPKDFTIQASETGEWNGEEVTLLTVTGSVGWAANEKREWELTTLGSYRSWRLDVTAVDGGAFFACAGFELIIDDGDSSLNKPCTSYGADLTLGETASSPGDFGGFPASNAIDDTAAEWSAAGGNRTAWFQVQFAAAKVINKITFQGRSGLPTRDPNEYKILASNTGAFGGEEVELRHGWTRDWIDGQQRGYAFENANAYTYYRIFYLPDPFVPTAGAVEIEMMTGTGCTAGSGCGEIASGDDGAALFMGANF